MSKTFIPLSLITDSPYQARIDTGDTEALAETILDHGLRQLPEARLLVEGEQPSSFSSHTEPKEFPAPVRSAYSVPEREQYEAQLASGHRRAQAVHLLNDDETITDADLEDVGLPPGFIPVDLQRLSGEQMLDLGTIENVRRKGLSPIEEARSVRDHVEMGRSNEEIGEIFGGKSASWVSSRKGLLELPKKVQMAAHEERISVRQAQALRDAYALQEDCPEAMAESIHDPDALFDSAKKGTKQSDDIRREVKRWKQKITAGDVEEEEVSPDVGTTHPEARGPARTEPESTEQTDGPDRNHQETEDGDEQADASARAQANLPGDNGGQEPGRDASEEEAGGAEAGADGGEHDPSAGPSTVVTEEVSGDGAPGEVPVTDTGGEPGALSELIAEVEREGFEWQLGSIDSGQYDAEVQGGDRAYIGEGDTPIAALQDAFDAARDVPSDEIGQVVPAQVDTLLSAVGEEMWDQAAADMSTIASLLVAHRVAGARQEAWRTELIVETVRERVGNVTEDDVTDETMQAVRNEVSRRLETQAA